MIKRILFYFLAALICFGVMSAARADYPASTSPLTVWCTGAGCAATPQAACDKAFPTSPAGTFVATRVNDSRYSCKHKTSGAIGTYTDSKLDYCPYGGTRNVTTNICVGADAPPPENPCSDTNEFIRRWNYPAGGVTPPPSSYDGCKIEVIRMLVCRKDPAGVTYCMWLVKRTGEPSSAAPDPDSSSTPDNPKDPPTNSPPIKPPPAPPGKNPCPEGTVQAGVSDDGVPICMGSGSNPRNPPPPPPKIETSTTEALPDGSTKTTKTTTTTNADGSKTTDIETTTSKSDGSKETSTDRSTSLNSAGQAGTADKPGEDQNNFCKQNPHLSICRESSVSGACGEISCVGDAIQCSTFRAAAAMQCQQKKDLEDLAARPEVASGNAILGGTDPQKAAIDAALKGTEVDMSRPALDDSGFVSSRSCLAPRTLSVAGKAIVINFDELCDNIEALRYAVLACAWIVAYLIVSRSVLNS